MKKTIYRIIRFLFGLYIIWLGLINLHELNDNHTHIQRSIQNYQQDLNIHTIFKYIHLDSYISAKTLNTMQYTIDSAMISLTHHTDDLIYLITFLLIIGGLLCAFGFKISCKFIQSAILLDLFFVHSYYYYRDERMKVNVLKMIAILGGAAHII
jgi:hypothetical protein